MSAVIGWFIAGAAGSLLLWAQEIRFAARLYRRDPIWCPTPRAIIGGTMGLFGGPIILLIGLLISFIEWQESLTKTHAWLATPICKKRED